jgi:hypothetical protein
VERNGSKKKRERLKEPSAWVTALRTRSSLCFWFTESALPFKINNPGYSPPASSAFPSLIQWPLPLPRTIRSPVSLIPPSGKRKMLMPRPPLEQGAQITLPRWRRQVRATLPFQPTIGLSSLRLPQSHQPRGRSLAASRFLSRGSCRGERAPSRQQSSQKCGKGAREVLASLVAD